MKGKKGDHRPLDRAEVAHSKKRQHKGGLAEQDAARSAEEAGKSKEPEQQTLVEAKAETPIVVRNGYLAAEFVKPHTERDKNDKAFVAIEISFPLLEEHRFEKVLPRRVIEVWDGLVDLGVDNISVDNVPAQVVELALAPDTIEKETALKLPFAEICNGKINVKESSGNGKAKEQTFLSFRVKVEWDAITWRWIGKNFGKQVWLKMQVAQGTLLEEEAAA